MILVVLFIGTIILVSALRNTYGALFADLGQDVPQFVVWAAAIVALGALGFIPGLKPISRGLMSLVLVVIILTNYKGILSGLQAATKVAPVTSSGTSSTDKSPAIGATSSTVPDYSHLDYVPPPAAYSSASIGH